MSHEGPVIVRMTEKRYTILCPMGHLVTGGAIDRHSWPGSAIESRIAYHQSGVSPWHVECNGAVNEPR